MFSTKVRLLFIPYHSDSFLLNKADRHDDYVLKHSQLGNLGVSLLLELLELK